jgi:GWxTD domain-containing protein
MRSLPLTVALMAVLFAGVLAGQTIHQKWLDEDVVYIITDAERLAFQQLKSDAEREQFIEQFWSRHNPAPGQGQNPFKEEHYRRIAYAKEHFAAGVPGWKTDRGRVYTVLGPPDEIESHPKFESYQRPPEEGGGMTSGYPFEQWRYREVAGVGPLILEFIDPTLKGEYGLANSISPAEMEALLRPAGDMPVGVKYSGKVASPSVVVTGPLGHVKISIPISGNFPATIYGRVTDAARHAVQVFEETMREPGPLYKKAMVLLPGAYHLTTVVRDAGGNAVQYETAFEVK